MEKPIFSFGIHWHSSTAIHTAGWDAGSPIRTGYIVRAIPIELIIIKLHFMAGLFVQAWAQNAPTILAFILDARLLAVVVSHIHTLVLASPGREYPVPRV